MEPQPPSFYARLFAEPKHERAARLISEARRKREANKTLVQHEHFTKQQHSEQNMGTSTTTLLKALQGMTESEFVKIVTRVAKEQFPSLSGAAAFTKLFTDDNPESAAIRTAHAIVKRAAIGGGAVDESPPDEDDLEDADALEELEELAEQERRRNPGMSKAVAFSKIYCDPANARLAQRERAQNRPRA
jgi:hypothetical protein